MSVFDDDDAKRRGAIAAASTVLAAVGDAVKRHPSLLDIAAADTDRLTATTFLAMSGPPSEADTVISLIGDCRNEKIHT